MAVVKGSKQDRLVVSTSQRGRRLVSRLFILGLIALLVMAAFQYGIFYSQQSQGRLAQENDQLRLELGERETEIKALRGQIAMLEKSKEVSERASEEVRVTIKDLEEHKAQLEEEISLYRGIMAPNSKDKGLRIQKIDILATPSPNRFKYKVVLTQVANNKSYIQGLVGINLVGVLNGEKVTIPLKDMSDSVDSSEIRFRFRYFQDIAGELVLPEGMVVEHLHVVAQSTGRKSMRLEQEFKWDIGEVHVGQG